MSKGYHNKPDHEDEYLEHIHIFQTMADAACEHQHLLTGTSGPPIPKGRSHVHRICVMTSYDPQDGTTHWHQVDVMTGTALGINCDKHTHAFQGETSYNVGHRHEFCSVLDASPEEGCYEHEHKKENCHCGRPEEDV